jgi:hypothetical protein
MEDLPTVNGITSTLTNGARANGVKTNGVPQTLTAGSLPDTPKRIVVVGLGMVAIAFIEKLLKEDTDNTRFSIVVIGEEPYVAYNRVGLSSFFEHRKIEELYLNPTEWVLLPISYGKGTSINRKISTTHNQDCITTSLPASQRSCRSGKK